MSKPDLAGQVQQMREALGRFDKEQLIEILSHVFTHYVLESDVPAALPPDPPLGVEDLSGLSFAQLIERLQLRLDVPELQQFAVQDGRVSVRIEGRLVPIGAAAGPDSRPEPPPPRPVPVPVEPVVPARVAPPVAPVGAPVSTPAPAPQKTEPAAPADEGGGRFAMLEID